MNTSSSPLTPEQALRQLAATPVRLEALAAGLEPERLHKRPGPEEWSANEVLAHLRACADQWGGCIMAMLQEDTPTLRAVNPRSWIKHTNYRELDFGTSLQAFAAQRAELLAILRSLSPEGFARSATVTGAGAVLVRTVQFYADWLARHERPHVKQIARIVDALSMARV